MLGRWITAGDLQQRCGLLSSGRLEEAFTKERVSQLIEIKVGKSLKERKSPLEGVPCCESCWKKMWMHVLKTC